VIGIDGGEWRVIRQLWKSGELPNLRSIADRGTTATLATAYNASPVIWTTIATGVTPHGTTRTRFASKPYSMQSSAVTCDGHSTSDAWSRARSVPRRPEPS